MLCLFLFCFYSCVYWSPPMSNSWNLETIRSKYHAISTAFVNQKVYCKNLLIKKNISCSFFLYYFYLAKRRARTTNLRNSVVHFCSQDKEEIVVDHYCIYYEQAKKKKKSHSKRRFTLMIEVNFYNILFNSGFRFYFSSGLLFFPYIILSGPNTVSKLRIGFQTI